MVDLIIILFIICFFCSYENELLFFNRKELLQKAKDKYHNCGSKEKAAKYHLENKDVIKEKSNDKYKHFSEEEKEAKREYGKNRYKK